MAKQSGRGLAFERLIQRGCSERELGGLLVLLHHTTVPLSRGRTLTVAPRDRYETMLAGASLKQTRANIKKARAATEKFEAAIAPLARARIWREMPCRYSEVIALNKQLREVLATLESAIGTVGPKAHPDFEGKVVRIIRYVREATGSYNDDLLAEVLGAASPPGMPKFPSGEALRVWRSERGLTGTRR